MRIRRLIIAICLVGSSLVLAGPAQAGWRWQDGPQTHSAPTIPRAVDRSVAAAPAASYGDCKDPSDQIPHYFTGSDYGWSGSFGALGATLWPTTDFRVCNGITLNFDGSSAWVAKTSAVDEHGIVQVGIIHCRDLTPNDSCPVNDQIRFFWAYGGCGHGATAVDLGPANYSPHLYQIQYNTRWGYNDIHLYIDSILVKALPHLSTRTGCWWDGASRLQFMGERVDRGDGLGNYPNPSSASLRFLDLSVFWQPTQTWALVTANCAAQDDNSYCLPGATTSNQYLWTVQ